MQFKLFFISSIFINLMFAMNNELHINFNCPKVIEHITEFRLCNDHVSGFHYYQPKSVIVKNGITLSKINDYLWVLTANNHNDFHDGYIIYQGKLYGNKSFFPCQWTKDQLKASICSIEVKQKIENTSNRNYLIDYYLENQLLKISVSYFPNSNKSFIKTVYPIIQNTKNIDDLVLKEYSEKQKLEILEKPEPISNIKDIKLSEIEDKISQNADIDYFYYKILSSDTHIAYEILIQSIRYYKSDIFDIALPYVKITDDILIKLVSKPRDDNAELERTKMIKFTLLQYPELEISDAIIKLALKTKSKNILEPLIHNYFYWNKLKSIPEEVKKDPIAKTIIAKFMIEYEKYNDDLLSAVYYGNFIKVKELISQVNENKLKTGYEISIECNNSTQEIFKEEINKRKKIKKLEQAFEMEKKKNELKYFSNIFKAKLDHPDQNIKFSEKELEIIRPFKNHILNKRDETPLLICASNKKDKHNLFKQLLDIDPNIKSTNNEYKDILTLAFEQYNINIIEFLIIEHNSQVIEFLKNWWLYNEISKSRCINFLSQFTALFKPWFIEIIKTKKFDLEDFNFVKTKLIDPEIDISNEELLIIACKEDCFDIVENLLINNKIDYKSALNIAPKGGKVFKLLNEKELLNKQIEETQLKEQIQKNSTDYAQKMGWTKLIKALHENFTDFEIISLIDNQDTDLISTDIHGYNAHYYALEKKRINIADKIYYRINSKNWDDYQKASFKKDKNEFKKLIKKNQPITLLDINLVADLETIDIYMNACNPSFNISTKIDCLIKISQIKTLNGQVTEAIKIYKSLLSKKETTQEQTILINFNMALLHVNENEKFSLDIFNEIIESKIPYSHQFKNKCKLEIAKIYYEIYESRIENTSNSKDLNKHITNLITQVLNDQNITSSEKIVCDYLTANLAFDCNNFNEAQILFKNILKKEIINILSPRQIGVINYKLSLIYRQKNIKEKEKTLLEKALNDLPDNLKVHSLNRLMGIYKDDDAWHQKLISIYNYKDTNLEIKKIKNYALLILGFKYSNIQDYNNSYLYYKKYLDSKFTDAKSKLKFYHIIAMVSCKLKKLKETIEYHNSFLKEAEIISRSNFDPENIFGIILSQVELASIYSGLLSVSNECNLIDYNQSFENIIKSLSNSLKVIGKEPSLNIFKQYPYNEKRNLILIQLLSKIFNDLPIEKLNNFLDDILKPEHLNFLSTEVKKLAIQKHEWVISLMKKRIVIA